MSISSLSMTLTIPQKKITKDQFCIPIFLFLSRLPKKKKNVDKTAMSCQIATITDALGFNFTFSKTTLCWYLNQIKMISFLNCGFTLLAFYSVVFFSQGSSDPFQNFCAKLHYFFFFINIGPLFLMIILKFRRDLVLWSVQMKAAHMKCGSGIKNLI